MPLKEKLLELLTKLNEKKEFPNRYEKALDAAYRDRYECKLNEFVSKFTAIVDSEVQHRMIVEVFGTGTFETAKKRSDYVGRNGRYFEGIYKSDIFKKMTTNLDDILAYLNEDQQKELERAIDETVSDFDKEPEALKKHTLHAEIEELKKGKSPEEIEALNYADNAIFSVDGASYQNSLSTSVMQAADATIGGEIGDTLDEAGLGLGITHDGMTLLKDEYVEGADEKLAELLGATAELSDGFKETLRECFAVFDRMQQRSGVNIVSGEEGGKVYGFFALSKSRDNLVHAIREKDVAKVVEEVSRHKETTEDLAKIAEATEKLYKAPYAFVGNVDITRNQTMPVEYARDLSLNSKMSNLYLLYAHVKANDLSVEDFLADPIRAIEKNVDDDIRKYGKSLNDQAVKENGRRKSLVEMFKTAEVVDTPADRLVKNYGFARSVSVLSCIEPDPNARKAVQKAGARLELIANEAAMQELNRGIFAETWGNYFEVLGTVEDALTYSDEERDYDQLNAGKKGYINVKTKQYVKPIDRAARLRDGSVTAEQLVERFKSVAADLIDFEGRTGRGAAFNRELYMKAVAALSQEALDAHMEMDDKTRRALVNCAEDPEKALAFGGDLYARAPLTKAERKAYDKEIANVAKATKKAEKDFIRAYKNATERADREALANERIETLCDLYETGRIPAQYFIDRVRAIKEGNVDKIPPFYAADKFPSKKDYVKQNDLADLDPEDAQAAYDTAKERALSERERFVQDWNQPDPDLDATELLRAVGLAEPAEAIVNDIEPENGNRRPLEMNDENEVENNAPVEEHPAPAREPELGMSEKEPGNRR